jgi:hypothetical protein
MSYFQSESESESESELYTRKSIRIQGYNKTKFYDIVKKIGDLINAINNESC